MFILQSIFLGEIYVMSGNQSCIILIFCFFNDIFVIIDNIINIMLDFCQFCSHNIGQHKMSMHIPVLSFYYDFSGFQTKKCHMLQ